MTALECWRRGCEVRVFERAKTNPTVGELVETNGMILDLHGTCRRLNPVGTQRVSTCHTQILISDY